LRGAGAGTPGNGFADEGGCTGPVGSGGGGEPDGVADQFLGDGHLSHQGVDGDDIVAGEEGFDGGGCAAGGTGDDLHLVVFRQVIHDDIEEETVELGFGERVGALHLDGVLGGEDEEGFLEGVPMAGGGDLVFSHGFEQGGLGLRRGAVDLIRQQQVGEDRAAHEFESARASVGLEDFGAGDVGWHQVGRELDPLEPEVEDLGDRFDEEGLGEAGRAGDEAMTACEERDEDLIDGLALSDDDLGQFGADAGPAGVETVEGGLFR